MNKKKSKKREKEKETMPEVSLEGGQESQLQVSSPEAAVAEMGLLLDLHLTRGINLAGRSLSIIGDIDNATFHNFDVAMTEMEFHNGAQFPIQIKICSPGGYLHPTLAIMARIRESQSEGFHINTRGYGEIQSAACLILASGDYRLLAKDAIFMYHDPFYVMEGSHGENVSFVREMERQKKVFTDTLARLSNKSQKFWEKVEKDTYFTSEQVLKMKLVDKLF